jgi:hypothetical protein
MDAGFQVDHSAGPGLLNRFLQAAKVAVPIGRDHQRPRWDRDGGRYPLRHHRHLQRLAGGQQFQRRPQRATGCQGLYLYPDAGDTCPKLLWRHPHLVAVHYHLAGTALHLELCGSPLAQRQHPQVQAFHAGPQMFGRWRRPFVPDHRIHG